MESQMMKKQPRITTGERKERDDLLAGVRDMIRPCIQCGTCSGSCPNEFAMDYPPRALWLLALRGETDEIFESQTFALCSACYSCTLRCPRGLKLTETMAALKQIATRQRADKFRPSMAFYSSFMDSVRRHGRVNEMEFMFYFFLSRKNPVLPLQFASLGLRLTTQGKVKPVLPGQGRSDTLEPLFRKVQEMEEQ
jgi:heterodisulfide reductase subunit C